jgi:hypothetical protein
MTILLIEISAVIMYTVTDMLSMMGLYFIIGSGLVIFWFFYWTMKANDAKNESDNVF